MILTVHVTETIIADSVKFIHSDECNIGICHCCPVAMVLSSALGQPMRVTYGHAGCWGFWKAEEMTPTKPKELSNDVSERIAAFNRTNHRMMETSTQKSKSFDGKI